MNTASAMEVARAHKLISEAIDILNYALTDEKFDLDKTVYYDQGYSGLARSVMEDNIITLMQVIDHLTDADFMLPEVYRGFNLEEPGQAQIEPPLIGVKSEDLLWMHDAPDPLLNFFSPDDPPKL